MSHIAHGWLVQQIDPAMLGRGIELGLSGIYPDAGKVTKRQVNAAKSVGLTVRTWGIADSIAALKRSYHSEAAGTTVDWPEKAYKVLIAC
jgi:glycerophosphoryl diester phosphodiesterase